ncbi:endonuclease/exonuclease/phosphatase family protein [Actinomadura spongiicola]|uniref:Endonuclease/exonuclease/phosphatase family protein n=1 Tax=Actinomadura spongiicola TaxID=2303421 RepID=A0A372G9Y2_9ACTN|nr:endonuclease/exonuclease/phosphatase family protein [Actinomadura spongiicola]RFS82198.1 endonuclease/exonuclease/phosphatase family protein [Actinomadura spongiicola]
MGAPRTIRVATYNLFQGGLDRDPGPGQGKDDSRLQEQVAILGSLGLDLIGLQEAQWGIGGWDRAREIARRLGMSYCFVGPSNFYNFDLAVFVRESDDVTVAGTEHLLGPPWVHGLTNVKLEVAGRPEPLHFLVGHSAPSSPTTRLAEAEMATVHRHLDAIYVADFNAAAIGEEPGATGTLSHKAAQKFDTRPAEELGAAGFHDVGAHWGDSTPTVGYTGRGLAYRCDRIHTTLPTEWITGYGVVLEGDGLSDHRAVWAEFTVGD